MLDITYIDTPIFVSSRGPEWHLFLRLGRGFRLIPPIERAIFCHNAPSLVRGDTFIPSWSNTAYILHSPMRGFSCFLRISLATSSVTTRGALRACDLSSNPLTPSCTRAVSVLCTPSVCSPPHTRRWKQQTSLPREAAQYCGGVAQDQGVSSNRGKRRIWMDGGGPEAKTVLIE